MLEYFKFLRPVQFPLEILMECNHSLEAFLFFPIVSKFNYSGSTNVGFEMRPVLLSSPSQTSFLKGLQYKTRGKVKKEKGERTLRSREGCLQNTVACAPGAKADLQQRWVGAWADGKG